MIKRLGKFWIIVGLLATLSGCSGPQLYSYFIDTNGNAAPPGQAHLAANQYAVRRGDTVYGIATARGVPMRLLIEQNGLSPPYNLYIGQILTIPDRQTHTVRRGETVYRIAQQHNVDMSALVRANDLASPYVIHVGQVLVLPGSTDPASDPKVAPPVSPQPIQTTEVATLPPSPLTADPNPAAAPVASSAATPAAAEPAPAAPETQTASLPPQPEDAAASSESAEPPKSAAIPQPPPRSGRSLEWPVKGKVVLPFGSVAKGMRNDGINISAKLGTSIRAAENGVVAYAGNELKGFGNMLLLKHSGGLITTYAHADEIKVQRGAVVKRGQIIASVGQTGNVSSPQLHFEVREGSKAVDPMKFLN